MAKRAIIMAGGTGGHVFPAISLAQELVSRGWSIHWLGGHRGIETWAVPEAGFDMTVLGTRALRGQGVVGKLMGMLALVKALIKALRVLRAQRPDLVVSLGGYTAGPGGLAARLMGVPLVLHEQNAVAGMTNKTLAKLAQAVAQAFPNTFEGLKPRATLFALKFWRWRRLPNGVWPTPSRFGYWCLADLRARRP